MSDFEKDFRTYLINDAEIGGLVGTRVHYGHVPQGYIGQYIWFQRSGTDSDTDEVLAGEPDQKYAYRESFFLETVSEDLQEAIDLAAMVKRLDGRKQQSFGAGSVQSIFVSDQSDTYEPHGVGDDAGRDFAALSIEIVGYQPGA